ncbi:hypothetical protein PQX77_016352 [Marasmius sp. AFHP31]|nr:hypothetical protein PQX77_016352 [Marasmius sp. AFHP31]
MSDSDRYVVTGPRGVANRLEIHDFVKNQAYFSLYVQALQKLQLKNQDEVNSFFQIGGIHGLPAVEWDPQPTGGPLNVKEKWDGYCTHGDVLFPTWHRPYMLLIEQAIQGEAMKIAETYKDNLKQHYKEAALKLRQPYWDWATGKMELPAAIISDDRVEITLPNGNRGSVANPFRRYTFNPLDPSFNFPKPFSKWQTTLRHPKNKTDQYPTEDIEGSDVRAQA